MTNAIPTDITVLKQLIALRLDVNIWSARKKLTPADFGTLDLPPEKLASLGSKKVCNPEDLRVFATLKARAISLLDRHGIRFLGGWAIPENAVKPVSEGLKAIATDFAAAKESFLARYDQAIQEWVSTNPGWEALIARSLVGIDTVRARLGFAWQMFKVVPPKGQAGQTLTEAVNTLGGSLFGEAAKVADEAWHKSFAGKIEVTAKALSPIKSLRHKLAGLSFVEPRVTPLVDLIDGTLAAVPDKGPITGTALVGLQGLVCLLRDPAAMIEHGQRIIEGQSPNDALLGLGTLPAADHAPAIDVDSFPDFNDDDLPPDLPMEPGTVVPLLRHGERPNQYQDVGARGMTPMMSSLLGCEPFARSRHHSGNPRRKGRLVLSEVWIRGSMVPWPGYREGASEGTTDVGDN